MSSYIEIEDDTLDQEFRKKHIGGSDIGVILGVNPYKSPFMLWLEKIGESEPEEMNEAMLRGKMLESQARNLYVKKTGTSLLTDKKFLYTEWPVLSASVDGISLDYKILYEAKCPSNYKLMEEAINNHIPEHYKAQMQQYLLILGAEVCDYHIHINDSTNLILNVYPDKEYHKYILQKAKEFWHMVENRIPPERRTGDPYYIMDENTNKHALEYKELKMKEMQIKRLLEEKEEILKEYVVDQKVIFGTTGLKATKCEGRETIDWKKVTEDLNLNKDLLNNYRKKSSSYILYKI